MLKGKKKKKQKLSESQQEEWRLSSATLSPAFSAPQTPLLAADQQSSTQASVHVEEVSKYFHVGNFFFSFRHTKHKQICYQKKLDITFMSSYLWVFAKIIQQCP